MLDIFDFALLIVLGSLGGFASGLLGVGGGIIFIPVLDIFLRKLGYEDEGLVRALVANSLFAIIFNGISVSLKHYRMGNFFPKHILITALPGVVSSLYITYLISTGDWYSKERFNMVFAFMLLPFAYRMFSKGKKQLANTTVREPNEIPSRHFSIAGLLTGCITSLSGLGGGVLMVPAFTDILKVSIKKATAISTGVIPLFALPVSILYMTSTPDIIAYPNLQLGYIIFPVVAPVILGTILMAPIGVKVAHKAPEVLLRRIFGGFIVVLLIKMIYEIIKG